jgi:hypothetical protein
MQATFNVTSDTGEHIIVRNITPLSLSQEWISAMSGILTQEEIQTQLEHSAMNEFMRIFPTIQRLRLGDAAQGIPPLSSARIYQGIHPMNDPQAAQAKTHPTLTKTQYDNLESRRFRKSDRDKQFEQVNCGICQEAFKSNQKIPKLPCAHDFHWICLKKWVTETRASCPLCIKSVID